MITKIKPLDDDYISPGLEVVALDTAFPDMIVGTKSSNQWPYLRREIRHHWYVDRRNPTVGFLSRDEAMILYNVARQHFGRPCLEIGCWRGWSTAHMALGAGNLEVIDPILADPDFREDVTQSLQRAGVGGSVVLHVGSSPDMVVRLSKDTGKRWSLVFIDGDHEGDAPCLDAKAVHCYASEDAAILLHDLASPDVAAALVWLRDHGWTTAIYQTMQIMGIAVRGVAEPVAHSPDPRQSWTLPRHLASFPIIGETRSQRLRRITADLGGQLPESTTGVATSELDAVSDADARLLDALLAQAAGLRDRLTARQAELDLSGEFERLQAKHIETLSRAADLELRLDTAQRAAEAASSRLRQEQEIGRDLMVERHLLLKMLDRVQRKHVEVLGLLDELQKSGNQANLRTEEALRAAAETAAQVLAVENLVELRVAIDRFAAWMARARVLLGLGRRLLAGRTKEVRTLIEYNLRISGVPDSLIPAAVWLARLRVVLGLVRRRALGNTATMQGHLVLSLERSFNISWVRSRLAMSQGAAAAALQAAELDRLRGQLAGLEERLAASQTRFAQLEAAKLADEQALLEADLTIARLQNAQETPG